MSDNASQYRDLQIRLNGFDKITLEEMGKVKLMNRIDTKYVTTLGTLLQLLDLARDEYVVQTIDGQCNLPYYTLYLDTDDYRMYGDHQRGKKTRKKIRVRRYESTRQTFLEVKSKNNKGRTKKKRVECELADVGRHSDFIADHSPFRLCSLKQCIENRFNRITLVNRRMTERLTIDTRLRFNNLIKRSRLCLTDIAIIELKRDGNVASPVIPILAALRIRPSGFSKYCMGMALTDPALRQNRFRERIRTIERTITMERGEAAWY